MLKKNIGLYDQYKGLSKSAYIFFIGRLVTNMGAFIWPLLTLILSKKMGISKTDIAFVSIVIMGLMLPANILGGKLADKFNKKKIIIAFDIISVMFFISCAFLEPGPVMIGLFALAGIFATMEGPAYEALIAESTKPAEREKVYSLTYLGANLGLMFGVIIGGFLFENHLNIAFVIDGITTISSTILIVLFVKNINIQELEEHEKNEYEDHIHESENIISVIKNRKSVFIQMIIFFIGAFIYSQMGFALPLYISDLYEGGEKIYSTVVSFNAFVVILFTPILTKLLDKTNEIPKIMSGIFLYSLSFLIIMNNPYIYVFFIMMFIFTVGEIVNQLGAPSYISRRVPASHRGRVNGIKTVSYMLGSAAGRVSIGITIDNYSYNLAFMILALVGLIGLVILTYNYKLDKKIFPKLYNKFV